jgi:hypothetical protein
LLGADLLYALGWALWTGAVLVVYVQIPRAKKRQYKRALDACEAAAGGQARAGSAEAPDRRARSTHIFSHCGPFVLAAREDRPDRQGAGPKARRARHRPPRLTERKDNTMSATQDYQAAEQLLRRPARPGELVIGDKIKPQWIDGGARFWYAVSNGAGKRFVLVDPAAGTREPAFDHARLAAALASTSGQPQVDPDALPFMAIKLAGNAVEFDAFGEHWRCRLDSYACERAEFTPPGNPLEVPSPDKKVAVPARRTTCGRASCPAAASGH